MEVRLQRAGKKNSNKNNGQTKIQPAKRSEKRIN
jgi:hypothetical protein